MKQHKEIQLLRLTSDIAFKSYFKYDPNLLIPLLQDFLPLPPGSLIKSVQLLDPEQSSRSTQDKTYILDIKVRLKRKNKSGLEEEETVNVEMQTTSRKAFTNRLLTYLARIYSGQIKTGEDYHKLRPVYSLTFTTANLQEFKVLSEYYHVCGLQRIHAPHLPFSDGMLFVVVELSKFKKKLEELVDQREAWCYFLKRSQDMSAEDCERLKEKGKDMGKAVKHLCDLSEDEWEMERIMQEEKYRLDRLSEKEYAFDEGLEKGKAEGRKEGEKKILKIASQMLKREMDVTLIHQLTGLSIAEIKRLKK